MVLIIGGKAYVSSAIVLKKLKDLLSCNLRTIRAYLLKEDFKNFWDYTSAAWAGKFLDAFNEDRQRMNTKHAAQNLAVIRQSALNLLRMDQTPKKMSMKIKQFCAALDHEYLQSLIMQYDGSNFNA